MAEGSTVRKDKIVCRFYQNSTCREGDRCKYSHDEPKNSSDLVCRYYPLGTCYFGDRCRYDHIRPKDSGNLKNVSRNDKFSPGTSKSSKEKETAQASLQNANNADKYQGSSNWVHAPEFFPKAPRSYADTLKSSTHNQNDPKKYAYVELCPLNVDAECPYGVQCEYVHGDLCEICRRACLHPYNEEQRKHHIELCEKEFEQDMELAFAMQRSSDKTCGICMDVILEKEPKSERQFGILEKCNHVFCLSCIRKWRKIKRQENLQNFAMLDPVVTRACPECRVTSNFITPSPYWVDNEDEKSQLIKNYKEVLSKKHCKYFQQGKGNCPFGGACFYLHAKPDGTKVELPQPTRRRRQNQDGELDFMHRIFLWDYLELHEENILMHLEFDDLISTWSESDDSDLSEMPILF